VASCRSEAVMVDGHHDYCAAPPERLESVDVYGRYEGADAGIVGREDRGSISCRLIRDNAATVRGVRHGVDLCSLCGWFLRGGSSVAACDVDRGERVIEITGAVCRG